VHTLCNSRLACAIRTLQIPTAVTLTRCLRDMLKWALTARVLKYILTSTGYSAICRHLFCAHRNETCWKTSGVLIWGPQTAECGEVALIPSVLQNVSFKFIISGWEQKNFIGISVNVCSFIHLKIFTYEGVSKNFLLYHTCCEPW